MAAINIFRTAQQWRGQPYRLGAEFNGNRYHPGPVDCSELTETACRLNGVHLPDGAENQYRYCRQKKTLIPVSEAKGIVAALGFRITSGGDHVVFSGGQRSGKGLAMEAKGRAYGCGNFTWDGRFNFAALIPGVDHGAASPPPTAPPVYFPPRRLVKLGDSGPAVAALQFEMVAIAGQNLMGEDAQQFYGPATQTAVVNLANFMTNVLKFEGFAGHTGIGVDPHYMQTLDLLFHQKTKMAPIVA